MKKTIKILSIILLSLLALFLILAIYSVCITFSVKLDDNKLINSERSIEIYDAKGNFLVNELNNIPVTETDKIPAHVKNAFIAIEDKRFYSHHGVDYRGMARAFFNNIKTFSFKEGGSTISQQLIKNTHLSDEKTFNRKIKEMKLASDLEKKYTKNEILGIYLNTIYFGENCYGITSASDRYFNKTPEELSINEGAILAGLVKAPTAYSPVRHREKCFERKNIVLKEMYAQKYITEAEYETAVKEDVIISEKKALFYTPYIKTVNESLYSIIEKSPYSFKKCKVYTYLDAEKQQFLYNELQNSGLKYDKTAVLINKDGNVEAFYSTCGDTKRQLGSTIKPILVYAPAIEENSLDECTPILDEKTDFGGYCPDNYNGQYYGYVSAKTALSKSLNVCAVKTLSYTGIDVSLSYLNKCGIETTENDKNLSTALGSTEKGATLTEITDAYTPFLNNGEYVKSDFISKIIDENGKILYKNEKKSRKVFGQDTAFILNDMMSETVKSGTAKNLYSEKIPLCAKTGTVGNSNGNTDAYCISYNKEYVLGIKIGNSDYSLMPNNVSGGTYPAKISLKIWNKVYDKKDAPTAFEKVSSVSEISLDSISYEEQKIEIADERTPDRYKIKAYFKNDNLPKIKSNRFSKPFVEKAKLSVNNYGITIDLCLTKSTNAVVYKITRGKKYKLFDTNDYTAPYSFTDKTVKIGETYEYSVIPYFLVDDKIIYGNETVIEKIKFYGIIDDESWWMEI